MILKLVLIPIFKTFFFYCRKFNPGKMWNPYYKPRMLSSVGGTSLQVEQEVCQVCRGGTMYHWQIHTDIFFYDMVFDTCIKISERNDIRTTYQKIENESRCPLKWWLVRNKETILILKTRFTTDKSYIRG